MNLDRQDETALKAIPRIPLAYLPTPLKQTPRLGAAIGGPRLWIKRDDLTGFGFGGNKIRGLEFLLADTLAQGADTLVTGTGPQSNSVRATAAAAAYAGLAIVAVYAGTPPSQIQGNYRLTRLLGAAVRFTGNPDQASVDEAIETIAAELRAIGRRPYAIPRDFELRTMQLSIVPDAFLHFVVTKPDNKYSFPLLIEVDRGSESQTVIEKKIEAYLRFTDNFRGGEYRDRFKKMSGTIVWFVTGDIKRLLNLREPIEDILTGKNLKRLRQFFYLGLLQERDPATLFLRPLFYIPFKGTECFPLINVADTPPP